ncbi:MAG: hypothetical protein ACYC5V_14420 [Gemmatimonadaceae bacterium]
MQHGALDVTPASAPPSPGAQQRDHLLGEEPTGRLRVQEAARVGMARAVVPARDAGSAVRLGAL